MVVQHNLTAMNANRYLGINNNKLSKSLEKLSSGYQINRAGDDAAGLAVSEKMRSQIAGMQQGVKNAQAGISMVQTYEGALTETDSILQRMKVLADQMANGSYDNEVDRNAANLEFKQLNDELNQIADTDYNGVVVLNGGRMADGTNAERGHSRLPNVGVASGIENAIDVKYDPTKGGQVSAVYASAKPAAGDNAIAITFKGVSAALDAGAVAADVADPNATANDLYKLTLVAGNTAIKSDGKGGYQAGTVLTKEEYTGETFTGKVNGVDMTHKYDINGRTYYGNAAKIYDENGVEVAADALKAELKEEQGGAATGVDVTKVTFAAGKVTVETTYDLAKYAKVDADLDVSESNSFQNGKRNLTYANKITLQVGARSKDAVEFTFQYSSSGIGNLNSDLDCSARGLGTDQLSIATQKEANFAIDQIDNAINKVSMVRGTFGAIQNRLEHKIDNLNVSVENLTSAESNIRDTNMPTEMMNFTKNQILAQASQSMLAQANQLPQSVLSLLQ